MSKEQKSELQQVFNFEQQNAALSHLHLTRPLVFFDLETTGLDLQIDRIIQFAFIRIQPDKTAEEWEELVNPGIPIPPEASQIHRITDEMVRDKPLFSFFAARLYEFMQNCDLAGFNLVRFDLPILVSELDRAGFKLDLMRRQILDAQVIFHKYEPRDLSAAYRFYCQKEMIDAHNALADVRATVEIINGQLDRYYELPRDLIQLAEFCATTDDQRWVTQDRRFYWRYNEAIIGFGKHKGKSLKWIRENDEDYLVWLKERDMPEETREMIDAAFQGRFPRRNSETV